MSLAPQIPIVDFHTHLFPSTASNLGASGIDQLLMYHYLRSEYLKTTGKYSQNISPKDIWNQLFFEKYPITEAQRGVSFILSSLNIDYQNMSYEKVLASWERLNLKQVDIINFLNIKNIIMTIDPLNKEEMELLKSNSFDSELWLNSLRLDNYFKNYLNKRINISSPDNLLSLKELKKLIDCYNPAYLALSASESDANRLFCGNNLFKLLSFIESEQIPLFLMLGVSRSENPLVGDAGDAIADSTSMNFIPNLLRNFSQLKLIVTHMNAERQRQLVSLARAFPNLVLGGSWWFRGTLPQLHEDLTLKLDLLGSKFISYFSDARVDEHLIYKWAFAKKEIQSICEEAYCKQDFKNNTLLSKISKKEFTTSLMTSLLHNYPLEIIGQQ